MANRFFMERITGVGPAFTAWEAVVLPMNYIRKFIFIISRPPIEFKQKAVEKCEIFSKPEPPVSTRKKRGGMLPPRQFQFTFTSALMSK